jgi:hypothetical protein
LRTKMIDQKMCVDQNTSKNNEGAKHACWDFNKDFLWQRDFVGYHEETVKHLIICFSFYFWKIQNQNRFLIFFNDL